MSGNSVLLLCAEQRRDQDFLRGGFLLQDSEHSTVYLTSPSKEHFILKSKIRIVSCMDQWTSNEPVDEQHYMEQSSHVIASPKPVFLLCLAAGSGLSFGEARSLSLSWKVCTHSLRSAMPLRSWLTSACSVCFCSWSFKQRTCGAQARAYKPLAGNLESILSPGKSLHLLLTQLSMHLFLLLCCQF